MNKLFSTLALTALFSSSAAFAADNAPQWNTIQASYLSTSIDDSEGIDPTGFGIAFTSLVGENVFITGSYNTVGDDVYGMDIDFNTANIGLGYRHELTGSTDLFVKATFESIELEYSGWGESDSEDDTGYALGVGLRSMITPNIEFSGELGYLTYDDESEATVNVSAFYYINTEFSIGATYYMNDYWDETGIAVRYNF